MKSIRLFIFLSLLLGAFFADAAEPPAAALTKSHTARMAAVEAWLQEDAALAEASKMPDLAAQRQADASELRAASPRETAVAAHDDLLPPISHFERNPVVEDFFKNLRAKILQADKRFPKGPEGGKARTSEGWAFAVRSDELLSLVQAFCHPQSPMASDPALVAPILRRLAFFAEYMAPGGPVLGDFGPCGNIADAYLMLTTCRPEIIPPSVRKGMDEGIRNNAEAIIAKCGVWFEPPGPDKPCLVNSDVNLVLAVAIANRLFPTASYAEAVRHGLAYIEPHILADGATNYIGRQNECPSYHGIAVQSLTRTAQITGDNAPLDMVKRLRWYYPLSVSPTGVMEWATATSWHHYWNTANGADSAAIMAALTDCPHNQRVANFAFKGNLWKASWWNPDRTATPAPDNYMTYDRNVEGPRGRYGTWSFVGTTRKTMDNRGKSSYVGCVIETGKQDGWPLDSALQDAGFEVCLDPTKDSDTEHHGRITLANAEPVTTCAVGDAAAALGAVAKLGSYGKPASEWMTRQTWLFTPERIVGLVQIEAGEETKAAGIFGELFLVSGRAGWGERKELKDLGKGNFSYGNMQITFHEQDFSGFDQEYTDVMGGGLNQSSSKKSCRLLLLDDAAKSRTLTSYAKGTRHFYLVELRPTSSAPATVTHSENLSGLLSFHVKDGRGNYFVAFNPTGNPVTATIDPGVLHRSGEKCRPEWLKDAGAVQSIAPNHTTNTLTLSPGEIGFVSDR